MDDEAFTGCLSFLNDGYGRTLQITMILGCLAILAAGGFVCMLDWKVGLPFVLLGIGFSCSWFYYDHLTQLEKATEEKAEEKTDKKAE
ncbi:Transmembrane domain-containing protein [Spironucleus salmonicida]|uniref:Transmembrane domain-containing protein n=1 Tax=Spironucleus salmonicida TaxID=348837 RepID=V6LCZ8_9EUKA|nr:Transmembrane domain-containing protein [Spironucleus salmonicida]|eukprot:EST41556.1 Transmembrane domain-containing protein [Spironucleus salmonicida]